MSVLIRTSRLASVGETWTGGPNAFTPGLRTAPSMCQPRPLPSYCSQVATARPFGATARLSKYSRAVWPGEEIVRGGVIVPSRMKNAARTRG